jgi:flagellin
VNSAAIGDGTGGTQTLQISNERGDFNIRGTVPADDQLSTSLKSASAISKANAINASSAESGVRAIASQTELTAIAPVQTATLDQTDYITLNGVEISGFQVQEKDADGSLVNAINAESSKTGVVASLTSDSHLKLVAEDGRNIEFNVTINLVGSVNSFGFFGAGSASGNGFDSFVATGKVTLQSEEAFRISSTNASVIGFSNEGLYGVNSENSVKELDISTREGAIEALDTVDLAIEQTSSIRSMLGALQNRLESTLSNISTTKENLSASRSRIMDADYAQETAMLSRNQIIQQASISVLAQAIQQPQSILTLLGS